MSHRHLCDWRLCRNNQTWHICSKVRGRWTRSLPVRGRGAVSVGRGGEDGEDLELAPWGGVGRMARTRNWLHVGEARGREQLVLMQNWHLPILRHVFMGISGHLDKGSGCVSGLSSRV